MRPGHQHCYLGHLSVDAVVVCGAGKTNDGEMENWETGEETWWALG